MIQHFALGDLHPSPTNRPDRSGFDDKSIAELAESIRGPGIIELLIARKNPHGKGYEIVCGERRWTAAKLIKLATAPCVVRELSDSEVREIQIIENLQREGLHPVEEAKGYYDLLSQKAQGGKPLHTIGLPGNYEIRILTELNTVDKLPDLEAVVGCGDEDSEGEIVVKE